MNKLLLLAVIIGITGCAPEYTPNTLPQVDPQLMTAPCKLGDAKADADEDVSVDVQNAECVRQLRLKVYRLQDWIKNVTE
ncbi:hypothetical protein MJN71_20685 [Salmonella enterica subsp. enterica serovar Cerro]|nr:hypothetical protein [Salmonella enterica subsp. enterica serovar Cerro]ECF9291446.1 hypothetical protein [Salmonella enterica]EBI0159822.1 hypothetical protein [Salmonella enterica subsp. enterica serovar Cerro]ECV1079893.1 hypothetical protein [Salmonella enterica subsp. enterica serovar Cerro]EEJ0683723.1 hypothetical protein [Salmonella enterica subsp. enterica serovar Cerro]